MAREKKKRAARLLEVNAGHETDQEGIYIWVELRVRPSRRGKQKTANILEWGFWCEPQELTRLGADLQAIGEAWTPDDDDSGLRIPVIPITHSGVMPITDSTLSDHPVGAKRRGCPIMG